MTYSGSNSSACLINRSAFEFAVSINTLKIPGLPLITSNVCVPTLPVEPRMAMFFLLLNVYFLELVKAPSKRQSLHEHLLTFFPACRREGRPAKRSRGESTVRQELTLMYLR